MAEEVKDGEKKLVKLTTLRQRFEMEYQEDQKKKEQDQKLPDVPQIQPLQLVVVKEIDQESTFVNDYIRVAITQTQYFFNSIFGSGYQKQNSFNYTQKQKIIRYVFAKNNSLQYEIQNFFKTQKQKINFTLIIRSNNEGKRQMKEIENLKKINRIQLVDGLIEARNRIGVMGYCWGAFFASFLHLSLFKNVRYWKRLAIWVTLFHISGQFVNWFNLDRFFDKVYPLFYEDLQIYNRQLQLSKDRNEIQSGQCKNDEIDKLFVEVQYNQIYFFKERIKQFLESKEQ